MPSAGSHCSTMPAQPARGQRALQLGAELVQIARAALDAVGAFAASSAAIVARSCSKSSMASRDRPAPATRASSRLPRTRASPDRLRRRNAAFDRAHDVEDVERRHARARFVQLDARERHIEALGGGANRERQLQSFVGGAALLRGQRRVGRFAPVVGQQRVLADLLREHALGKAGHEHHPERSAARGAAACRRRRGRAGGAAARASASTAAASARRGLRAS